MEYLEYNKYKSLREYLRVEINQDIIFSLSRYYFEHNRFEYDEDGDLANEFFDFLYRDFDYFIKNMNDFRKIETHFSHYRDKLKYISTLVSYYHVELTPIGIKSLDYICQQSVIDGNSFFNLIYHKERLFKIGDRINELLLSPDSMKKLADAINLESELDSIFKIEQLKTSQADYLNQLDIEIKRLEKLNSLGLLSDKQVETINNKRKFRIAPKKKTDFIKVISAMYDAKIFVLEDKKAVMKKQDLMAAFASLLNDDFSKYSNSLAQAKDGKEKMYLKTFKELEAKAMDYLNAV